jgi:Abortive infection alpha
VSEPPSTDPKQPPPREREPREGGLLGDAPGLARVWAGMWRNTAGWTLDASRQVARRLLGVGEPARRDEVHDRDGKVSLRDRGAELLRRSADVDLDEDTHPAYERILSDLAPDEARVLRLLAEGPQPSVDVRSGWLPIGVRSELLAPGLNMIGAEAGCRHADRVPAYLNNLYRLGLIWFSRESLRDPAAYQVLEAQPEVAEAMAGARRSHTVRRSIHLTPFGVDFCRMCLPPETGEAGGRPQN